MSFEVIGKLYKKFDTVQIKETFKKREFVLEIEDGNYTDYIKFQLLQDKCSVLDPFAEGDELKVHFNLKGRPYNNRQGGVTYFTNLNAWRIESNAPQTSQPPATGDDGFPSLTDIPPEDNTPQDDLPF